MTKRQRKKMASSKVGTRFLDELLANPIWPTDAGLGEEGVRKRVMSESVRVMPEFGAAIFPRANVNRTRTRTPQTLEALGRLEPAMRVVTLVACVIRRMTHTDLL